ncbi:MAG: archease [Candidatus Scalindua sp. AMX11]|nr:MAG: archease [Candidatus Scalindua sp.]NOG84621.1 archease [Planctomycetota bacterium]RZV92395.1 MAG: archease [Candidatus Scalindua sp. SCAELEC01]TDE66080.1 MAG: archease [Candidatus Scalindua sp. AMX11]GJQ59054.1 MAG: protein archease [Candidatus Scalindua sp.]
MKRYTLIDHTADIGIDIFGDTLSDLFSNAGFAMFDIITDITTVEAKDQRIIKVEGIDREQLLVDWLGELLYLYDVKNLLFKDFLITDMNENQLTASLTATIRGEKYCETKHTINTEIKAVTHHALSVKLEHNRWKARVIFDL